jgi:hypothetical protein
MPGPDYEAAMKSYWLAYEFDPNDDETAVKNAVDAALGDNVLYVKPKSPPDQTPSMGGPNHPQWHQEKSVMSFFRKATETGWLVKWHSKENTNVVH